MKRATYVSIPQPCHENWDAMTPQDKGCFCASCAKTVIDFSQMSDAQVLNYLSQAKGRVCGRFAQDQIERPLIPLKKDKKKWWWMAALMPLTLFLSKANGQSKITKKATKIEYQKDATTMGFAAIKISDTSHIVDANKVITGTVVDENNQPIYGASVVIKGTNTGTATDSSGKFLLSISTDKPSLTITVSYIGYETKELSYSAKDIDEINANAQLVYMTPQTLGEVIVIGYTVRRHPVKKIDTVKTAVRKICGINSFKIYPNPVRSGEDIRVEVKKEGHYSIQLLDANSKLVANSLFDAEKGITATTLTIPAFAAAGVYFIQLINEDTKQQYTDKVIVQ